MVFFLTVFTLIFPLFSLQGTDPTTVLFLGDSLTEGYGIAKEQSYPFLVRTALAQRGVHIEVLNGSVSGSTTASSTSRLKWFLRKQPRLLFLALGANDALRGIKTRESYKHLAKTIELAREKGMIVVLAGMKAPPNYGVDYAQKVEALYKRLAKTYKVHHLPFLLEGVAGKREYNQEDGIHPNRAGHQKMAQMVSEFLYPILKPQGKKGR